MIAIAGGKGGCGKTTTTVALARALSRRPGPPPLAADADWDMPDLHALAGGAPTPSLAAVSDGRPPRAVAQTVGDPPVDLLPAPRGERAGRVGRTLGALAVAEDRGGTPTLLDCPAGAGRDAAVPLRVADGVVLVSTDAPASLRDAAKTAAMAEALGTPVVGGALTRTASRPAGAARLLGTDALVPFPDTDDPLDDPDVGRAAAALADLVLERRPPQTGAGRI